MNIEDASRAGKRKSYMDIMREEHPQYAAFIDATIDQFYEVSEKLGFSGANVREAQEKLFNETDGDTSKVTDESIEITLRSVRK